MHESVSKQRPAQDSAYWELQRARPSRRDFKIIQECGRGGDGRRVASKPQLVQPNTQTEQSRGKWSKGTTRCELRVPGVIFAVTEKRERKQGTNFLDP